MHLKEEYIACVINYAHRVFSEMVTKHFFFDHNTEHYNQRTVIRFAYIIIYNIITASDGNITFKRLAIGSIYINNKVTKLQYQNEFKNKKTYL